VLIRAAIGRFVDCKHSLEAMPITIRSTASHPTAEMFYCYSLELALRERLIDVLASLKRLFQQPVSRHSRESFQWIGCHSHALPRWRLVQHLFLSSMTSLQKRITSFFPPLEGRDEASFKHRAIEDQIVSERPYVKLSPFLYDFMP
jgi:hypothetical protein